LEIEKTGREEKVDEASLGELFAILWQGKAVIIAVTLVFAFASVFFALSVPNQYRATVVLAPAQSDGGGLSGALGQLGGLASLAGVNIGGSDGGETQIAQQIMRSWGFIDGFINQYDLAVEIFAAEGWREASDEILIDTDIYDVSSATWLIEDDGVLRPPTSWELFKVFADMLTVSEDKKTGLVSVSIEYYSPLLAKQWLDMYLIAINEHMQRRQVKKVSRNIEYLEDQIAKTSIAEMQGVFYTIIEEQIKSKMLAEASPNYAFAVVNPSMVPEEKSQPKRALICVLGTLLGGILSVLWVLVRYFLKSE
jgi:LPS O-antigen subunit length determinant protein (WzzB/FepE family)